VELPKREKSTFPLSPALHNQTPPEVDFVGRVEMLETITEWYKNPEVRIGALIGWGGVGKSALIRKWYDLLEENKIQPDGIFWWGFYRNAYLEAFLNALLRYVSQGKVDLETIKSTYEKVERIKEYFHQAKYLIILDGLEQMQKSESGDEFGKMIHRELTELLRYLADATKSGLCLITTRCPLRDLDKWQGQSFRSLSLVDLSLPDALAMLKKRGVKGSDEDMEEVVKRYKGHALSLTSVAGFLKRYYEGDIKKAPDVRFVLSDEERFKDVNKLLRRYAEKMSEEELCFLNIFSLFRKEITEKEFSCVFRHKMGFNKGLVKMNELDFKDLVSGLVDWRLISFDEAKKTYTTHPLI
jgi:PAS domain-containing protein